MKNIESINISTKQNQIKQIYNRQYKVTTKNMYENHEQIGEIEKKIFYTYINLKK